MEMEQPKIEFHKEKEKLDDRCGIRCIQFGAKEAFQSKSVCLDELFKLSDFHVEVHELACC